MDMEFICDDCSWVFCTHDKGNHPEKCDNCNSEELSIYTGSIE